MAYSTAPNSVSNSPVPELSFLSAPYRGWTRAGEKRVQDNLHAHVQNEPIKNYYSPYHAARVNVSRNAFFSSRAEKKKHIFFDVDIVVKKKKQKRKNENVVYRSLCS